MKIADLFSWRRPGALLSAGGHIALLVASVAAFSQAKPFTPAEEAVPVDIISSKDFNEMMRGDKSAKDKLPEPKTRVDKVAETRTDNDPGEAKKDVAAPPPPKAEPKPEPEQKVAALPPPPPPRPPEIRVKEPTPPVPPKVEKEEPDEKDAEIVRQLPPKREPPKKEEPKPEPPKVDPVAKLLEEKRLADEKAAADAKKLEDKLKEDKRKADEKKKADAAQKAQEEADAKKLQDAIRQKLLTSKEAPSSQGATGATVSRQASLGTATATGKTLSPSDRAQLGGLLKEQMDKCMSVPPGATPKTAPMIRLVLGRDGAIIGGPTLQNNSGEPGFRPFAEASMRALRNCQPYRIPARFLDSYEDWKTLSIFANPAEY